MSSPAWWLNQRTSRKLWTPILSLAPRMIDCPTATGGNTFVLLKAQRSRRRAYDGLRQPWQSCGIPSRRKPELPAEAGPDQSGDTVGYLVEATTFPRRVFAFRSRSCRLRRASRSRPSRAADAISRTRASSSHKEDRSRASHASELRLARSMRMGITLWRTSGLSSWARTRPRTGTTSATQSSAVRSRRSAPSQWCQYQDGDGGIHLGVDLGHLYRQLLRLVRLEGDAK